MYIVVFLHISYDFAYEFSFEFILVKKSVLPMSKTSIFDTFLLSIVVIVVLSSMLTIKHQLSL